MAGFIPSESILGLKSRTLRHQTTPMRGRPPKTEALDIDISPLVDLYTKHQGDLGAIFAELGEDPGKAKKYPPTDANDFAAKYVVGKFTYVSNIDKIRERAIERAGGDEELAEMFSENAPEALPEEMEDAEAELHPVDILKQMFPDIEEEVIVYVLDASQSNIEEAAAGLWFMKIMKAFMVAGATTVPLPETPPEEMTTRELMDEIKKEKLDARNCLEKSELVSLVKQGRASKAAAETVV